KNLNVYIQYPKGTWIINIIIYLTPLVCLIVQGELGWIKLEISKSVSCAVNYVNIYIQIINIIIGFVMAILLNALFLYLTSKHVQRSEQTAQKNLTKKRYQRLQAKFFIVYTIWMVLWGPYVIVYQTVSSANIIVYYAQILSYFETLIDPFIFSALDKRLFNALPWLMKFKRRRIHPVIK
ncbi:unnamed protein product, partial [Didymodactylos carnosus]